MRQQMHLKRAVGLQRNNVNMWCEMHMIQTYILMKALTTKLICDILYREELTWGVMLMLQPFYGPLDFVWDYPSEPVPEK